MANEKQPITFLHLAELVLSNENSPLTVDEIWIVAEKSGLLPRLQTTGKTPIATLGARLYMSAKAPESKFVKIGDRPARFALKSSPVLANLSTEELEKHFPEISPTTTTWLSYHERELHPLLVWFAKTHFEVDCKTIYHEKSVKRAPKHNQWLHPDIAGFALMSKHWDDKVVALGQRNGCKHARFFSFEIKSSLDFSTLREFFFQAVSNSSWANQGYLAVAQIDEDPDFRDELTRLSESFGIGVIRLDTGQPLDSEVLLPACEKPDVDWETVNRIAKDNADFREYISSVTKSIEINQIVINAFDAIYTDEKIFEYVKSKLARPPTLSTTTNHSS
jgi:hypothetical protein